MVLAKAVRHGRTSANPKSRPEPQGPAAGPAGEGGSRPPVWLILRLLAPLLLSGCYATTALFTSAGDYADYRRVRLAPTLDERLAAASYYLEHRPDGAYAGRLKRFFKYAEPIFFAARRRNEAGLEAYLLALPRGPHAKEALADLMDLREAARRQNEALRGVLAAGRRLDIEKAKREQAAQLLWSWIGSLLDPRLWRAPLTEAPAAFLVRYRLALPEPICQPDAEAPDHTRCLKILEHSFRLPGEGELVDRHLAIDVQLLLDSRWQLLSAELAGPALFVRATELQAGQALAELEPADQRQAQRDFISRFTGLLFELELMCNGGTDAAGVLTMDCGPYRAVVGQRPAQGHDAIRLERVAAPPEPPTRAEVPDGADAPEPAPEPGEPAPPRVEPDGGDAEPAPGGSDPFREP